MHVALPAAAAFAENELLAVVREVGDRRKGRSRRGEGRVSFPGYLNFFRPHPAAFILINNRSHRHFHHLRQRAAAVHLLPLPVSALFRLDDRLVEKVGEIVGVNVGAKNDVAAATAITAIGTAARHELLAAKTHAAASAVTGLGKNFYSIDKHNELWGFCPERLRQGAIVSIACHPESRLRWRMVRDYRSHHLSRACHCHPEARQTPRDLTVAGETISRALTRSTKIGVAAGGWSWLCDLRPTVRSLAVCAARDDKQD